MNRLFIAEKPSVGRAIALHLSKPQQSQRTHIVCGDDVVTWCVGHILQDFKPEDYSDAWSWKGLGQAFRAGTLEAAFPMLPEAFKLRPNGDLKEQFDAIKRLAREARVIVHAGDIDREGQLIVDEVLEFIGNRKTVLRLDTSSLDDVNLARSLANLTDNAKNHPITLAGHARRQADWLFGMNLTVAYTFAAQKGGYNGGVLNVGRVKTPTMRLVVDRDREIENFKPKTYFIVIGMFEKAAGPRFEATWKPNRDRMELDEENRLLNRAPAEAVVTKIRGAQARVVEYLDEEKKQGPKLPYSASELQADASRIYGFSAARTLEIAQKLYDSEWKLITYPRTDCRYLPEAQRSDARAILSNLAMIYPEIETFCRDADATKKSAAWNDGKVSAHHAIIPTQQRADLSRLRDDERKIYDLIVRRYVAQFLPDYRYRRVTAELECAGERFTVAGNTPVAPGWKALYGAGVSDEDEEKGDGDARGAPAHVIPKLAKGEMTTCVSGRVDERQTTPLARFTEGTLVKAMAGIDRFVTDPEIRKRLRENDGIGTEATRASIIEDLKRREFFATQGKSIMSTMRARALVDALNKRVTDYGVTAQFEASLSKIAEGTVRPERFMEILVKFIDAACKDALQSTVVMPREACTRSGRVAAFKSGKKTTKRRARTFAKGAKNRV